MARFLKKGGAAAGFHLGGLLDFFFPRVFRGLIGFLMAFFFFGGGLGFGGLLVKSKLLGEVLWLFLGAFWGPFLRVSQKESLKDSRMTGFRFWGSQCGFWGPQNPHKTVGHEPMILGSSHLLRFSDPSN